MKLIKKMTVLSLAVLALGGCTQSSISSNAPDMVEGVDPAKMNQEEDETLPREENILLENEDEKEFELEELPVKSQRKVIESSDEEKNDEEEAKGKRRMEIELGDGGEGRDDESNSNKKKKNGRSDGTGSNDSSSALKEMNGLIIDSKSEDERKEFIQSNLKRLSHRMDQESVSELMEAFL